MNRKILSREQWPPATASDRRTYVNAAPGSGKTFIAVERFGYLRFNSHLRDPRGIAAMSFARSASDELRARIVARWGVHAARWPNFVSTFDEFHRSVLRHLLARGVILWPQGHRTLHVQDSWQRTPGSRRRLRAGDPWLAVSLDETNQMVVVSRTTGLRPSAFFTDEALYAEQLAAGVCTHDEVHAVLRAALHDDHAVLGDAIREYLLVSYAHVIVDEIFDLNELDVAILRTADDAGVELTILGDPWQSVYTFRGSRPDLVHNLVSDRSFRSHDVIGSHRYTTTAMRDLAANLAKGLPFSVPSAEVGRVPSVLLSRRWQAMWEQTNVPALPAGCGALDGSPHSAALILLLHEVTVELFRVAATGIGEARMALSWDGDRTALIAARAALSDPDQTETDIWEILRAGLEQGDRRWVEPGRRAKQRMARMITLMRGPDAPILGLSVHQAKGLQWPHVDVIDPLLPNTSYTLDQDDSDDRLLYVALTRAERTVCVRQPPPGIRW